MKNSDKIKRFVKTVPMKLYVLLAAVIIFSFFSNDFGLVDIQKTAVILAAGIDREEEGYSLTAQIAVPKGSERNTGGTSSVEIEGKGKTISDCMAQIYAKTGWVPKLVFCNLLVLGEETVKENVFGALDFFLRNEYMPDSCLLAVSEGKAGELLSSVSAIDDTSSLAVGKLFSDAAEKSGKVLKNSLKEFSIGYHGVSKSSYLPIVRMSDQEGSESSGQAGGQSPGGSSSGSSSGGESQKIYNAEETALFYDGKMVGKLTDKETFAYNLLDGKVFSGAFTVGDGEKNYSVTVLKNGGDVSLDMKGAPVAKLKVELKVSVANCNRDTPVEEMAKAELPQDFEAKANELLTAYITELWNNCVSCGCDLFNLNRMLYRSSLKKYGEWKDALLSSVKPEITAKVESVK